MTAESGHVRKFKKKSIRNNKHTSRVEKQKYQNLEENKVIYVICKEKHTPIAPYIVLRKLTDKLTVL